MSIDVFDINNHPETNLINIATGKIISNPTVNVKKSWKLGKKKLQEFESNLPGGYHSTIYYILKLDGAKKGIEPSGKKILDLELIYARALALRLVNPDFDFDQILLSYELAPFPPSLFDKENVLHTGKLKLNLMKTLKGESNARLSVSNQD